MTLQRGDRLGPYEVLAPIGAGGMGQVFRCRDTRLERIVAIKVLSPHLRGQADFHRRFETEARAISSLHHPHICTLFDIGEFEGVNYLVMEHLEGEALDQRLKRGPIPLPEALGLAGQILQALQHAHSRHILHRDLKPGNIFLIGNQRQPWVKLLDFGLAKAINREPPDSDANPDRTEKLNTDPDQLIGTPLYMAPEVLQGRPADPRSDLHAFGVIFHEMLTGQRAFNADSQGNAIAAVLRDEPKRLSDLVQGIPPGLDTLVSRCLTKDPGKRWQSADELLAAFELSASEPAVSHTPTGTPRPLFNKSALAGASLLLGLVLAMTAAWLVGALPRREKAVEQKPESRPTEPAARPVPSDRAAPAKPRPAGAVIVKRSSEPPPARPPPAAPSAQIAPAPQTPPDAPSIERRETRPAEPPAVVTGPPVAKPSVVAEGPQQPSPEVAEWELVRTPGNLTALEAFLKRYPAGKFHAQARRLAEQAEWNGIQESESQQILLAFSSKYPDGEFAPKASARVRELDARLAAGREIGQLLRRYAEAYRRKNIRDIIELWPSLAPGASREIAAAFAASETIEFDLMPLGEPVLSEPVESGVYASPMQAATARVVCLRKVKTVMRGGERPPPVENRVAIRVRRAEGRWTLISVTVE